VPLLAALSSVPLVHTRILAAACWQARPWGGASSAAAHGPCGQGPNPKYVNTYSSPTEPKNKGNKLPATPRSSSAGLQFVDLTLVPYRRSATVAGADPVDPRAGEGRVLRACARERGEEAAAALPVPACCSSPSPAIRFR
jgi:hypothetical protein